MIWWKEYKNHECEIVGKKRKYDNTIYTFDIETTSFFTVGDTIMQGEDYLKIDDYTKDYCEYYSTMYIWQFGINDKVYYGRTEEDLINFLEQLEITSDIKKIVYVHNLSFEFQYLSSFLKVKNVKARASRKVMAFDLQDFNIQFRCSLYLTNVALEKIPNIYDLDVKKKVGFLDYQKIRHSKTVLTEHELEYCEFDCLVLYEYIKKVELPIYQYLHKIPLTSTGKVRKELQKRVLSDQHYRNITGESINVKPNVYNLLLHSFAGGYTHGNSIYIDEVLDNIDSFDEASAYPYVMTTCKFPMKGFTYCKIDDIHKLNNKYAYLVHIIFYNVKCKYHNTFISASKCLNISDHRGGIDNGRILYAGMIEIVLTDVDLKFILDTYDFEDYEIVESYRSLYQYLPKLFIEFILEKYVNKTQFKNVEGKELEYTLEKAKFNSLYGMTVTNLIRDKVDFRNDEWIEEENSNEEIIEMLLKEKNKCFLSFAWGVWVTSYARDNLLRRVIELDDYTVYCDTDSVKLVQGYDENIIENYNKTVEEKIKNVSKVLKIPYDKFAPKDVKGKRHLLGIFEKEVEHEHLYSYDRFITQGAKKYAYEVDNKIHITVAGVPKCGSKCLKSLDDFRDNLLFDYKNINKHIHMYNDNQKNIDITDYNGIKYKIRDKKGICILPIEYTLGKSLEFANFLTDNSSKRSYIK